MIFPARPSFPQAGESSKCDGSRGPSLRFSLTAKLLKLKGERGKCLGKLHGSCLVLEIAAA
jgi:hypothetical protein